MNNSRPFSVRQIIFYGVLCLLFGHLLLKDFMPNPLVGAVGFLILVSVLFYVIFVKQDIFGFILIIFLCSHFNYANIQGGLWNLITVGMIIVYYLISRPKNVFNEKDSLIRLLVGIFVISNLAGYLFKNQIMPPISQLLGAATLFSYVLMFKLVSNMVMTPERVKKFILVMGVAIFCMFVAALNQQNAFVSFNTPLLGGYSAGSGGTIVKPVLRGGSTFNHYELFGEYAMLSVILLIPFIVSSYTKRELRLQGYLINYIAIISIFNMVISGTRSSIILVGIGTIGYIIFFIVFRLEIFDRRKSFVLYAVVTIAFVFVVGNLFGLGNLSERMDKMLSRDLTLEGVLSGQDINRAPIFFTAMNRIQEEPWYIGYGWSVPDGNAYAWFGKKNWSWVGDLHSLYLSLPMLYGWFGSAAFLLLIIVALVQLIYAVIKWRQRKNYLITLSVGFVFFWIFFLADQFKISILRNPNYHMIFWIWLGLSNAAFRTLRASSSETGREKIINSHFLENNVKGT